MNNQITRIREKLKTLSDQDLNRIIFGARKHQYKLNACILTEELRRFEALHNIKLPREFITFYTTIGNGGAGPFYGLEPLENMLFSDLDYKRADSLLNPSHPFLHTQPWNIQFEPTIEEEDDEALYDKEREAFYNTYYSNDQMNGVLAICNYGCGISINLVVNGPEYGYMWTDDRGNEGGIYPSGELGNQEKIRFLDWYELWLDNSITEAKHRYIKHDGKVPTAFKNPVSRPKPWWKFW